MQLVSTSTGRSLQIVQTPAGQLTVDGLGNEGPNAKNGTLMLDTFYINSDRLGLNGALCNLSLES